MQIPTLAQDSLAVLLPAEARGSPAPPFTGPPWLLYNKLDEFADPNENDPLNKNVLN